ncbi:MAG TPA: hypothetical protein VLI39_13735 [Sedimentisphaerales bacterium]|nr:hypothetical protein [Sedimentisphaerales bacterium]
MTAHGGRRHDAGREVENLAIRLCGLLEEQLAAVRKGDFSRIEQLGEQTSAVVAGIAGQEGGAAAISRPRRRDLKRSYDELSLMLEAEQADVQSKLRQLRKVKRAIGAYGMDR